VPRTAMPLPALALLGFVLAAVSPLGAQTFELEEILAAPYVEEIVAASEAERIAFSVYEAGVRSLWTATPPAWTPLRLFTSPADDGLTLGGLQLSADGSVAVYVLGGGPNQAGEIPNPTSHPDGGRLETWAVDTSGSGEPRLLAKGRGVLSPAGDRIVFTRGKEVFEALVSPPKEVEEGETRGGADDEAPEATRLFSVRVGVGFLLPSPDGRRIAFVSERREHSLLGVFDRQERTVTWMAPSADRDYFPAFSPDSSRIAWVRYHGLKMGERENYLTGWPYGLWVADPATGEGREVWRTEGAGGGFVHWYVDHPVVWAGDERLVFHSEHQGWHHLYSLAVPGASASGSEAPGGGGPASREEPRELTPGEGELEGSAVSPDGTTVYFAGNFGDTHRRHLFRVPVVGGEPRILTPGEGIETDPIPLAGGRHLAFRGGDVRRPQAAEVVEIAGGAARHIYPRALPSSFPRQALREPELVRFTAPDGLPLNGELFHPPGAREGERHPAVIFLHGGPVRQMLLGYHYSGYYARAYAFNQYLASRGYLVLALNYRSGIGYGQDFRAVSGYGPEGAREYQDVAAAGRWLAGRSDVDPAHIGLWGGSYGGYLTALALARNSDLFAAGVDLHGVHDWTWPGDHFPEWTVAWNLVTPEDQEVARRASPVANVEDWRSPVLLIHGDDDRNVFFVQTTDLRQRLRERGVPVELLVFPDEVHSFLVHRHWLEAYRAAEDFFGRWLGGSAEEKGPSEHR